MPSKILIVEDESIVALDLQRRLIVLGYEVPRVAASHDQAMKAVNEIMPDIVLMDINISGDIDGIDTAAKINVPVIYLTAYSEEKTLERAKATKPYGYLIKPFSERELHATIQMALERHNVELRLKNNEEQLAIAYANLEVGKRELEVRATELFQEKQRLEVTLNSIGDGVITTDEYGNVTYLNPVAEEKTGWTILEACGQAASKVLVIVNEETQEPNPSPIEAVLRTGKISGMSNHSALIGKHGIMYAIEDSAAPMLDRDNKVIGVVLVFHDVSDARRLSEEMTYQATHDALTDLVNRSEFDRRLQKAIESSSLHGHQHALAYLDLDQFKIVNDTCGHNSGDELLRQITGLLRLTLRANDTLARLGGDEFGVLLESCPPYFALQIAENLRNIIGDFHFVWDEKTFPISVSIGLVNFGGNGPENLSCAEILRIADSACYTAKDLGRNRIHVYMEDDYEMSKRHGEIDWYTKIYSAITQNRFVLYAQKIVSLNTTQPYHEHVEILLRLINTESQIIPPMAFIPAAERYGLMPEIDRWVVRTAFAHIAKLEFGATSLFSINLSGASLNDEKALPFIFEQLETSGVNSGSICFEITETAAITNLLNARAFIIALQSKGCKFALDDFGSGMSSFSYLKHLPVNFLKIDGCFVKDIANDPVDAAMVAAINNIGHVMVLETIAEFVEDKEILKKLREIGVDYAQGYEVGHPVPLSQLDLTAPKKIEQT
ncbi:EAL domain-containing protein [Solimicrobium silvestre]|uniref:GGDEF: diguanylate cyclase (GGDEF) domain n=1 Tax=Solimicrobium silvestre TaxID=2099400 RepID=A0A2S9GW55_9BURK|nr:EAL domain-containing protein [Solimicrobium silvestre]PRC91953.1 GGDEF: diguanylate cyclase (GGDEF) domain [Solimicrobium silvestre]